MSTLTRCVSCGEPWRGYEDDRSDSDHICSRCATPAHAMKDAEGLLDRAIQLERDADTLRRAFRTRSGPWHYVGDLLDEIVTKLSFVESLARVAYHSDRRQAQLDAMRIENE